MNSQVNELGKGEKSNNTPNRYHLRSKKKEGNFDSHDQSLIVKKPATITTKEKKTQNTSLTTKEPVSEVREAPKPLSSFSFEHKIQNIRILVPLSELVKNEDFKRSLSKLLHDKVLHNYLMDSGASHNLMPKIVMEELGLEVTKDYHDLYSFDSRRVQFLGVIKDLVVSLFQLPMKSVVMDIVVADVPPKFNMLLSRSWIRKFGGTLQMDLTYATIPIFGGEYRRLYREAQLAYIVSDEEDPTNHPIFALETDLGSSLLQITETPKSPFQIRKKPIFNHEMHPRTTSIWKIFFDGDSSSEGVGARVVLVSPW
jgi:hypothetical protein